MSLPSPSRFNRLAICAAAGAYPELSDEGFTPRSGVSPSTKGRVVHRYLADVPKLGAEAALAAVPEAFRAGCAAINLSALPASEPDAFAPEVSFAWDLETGRARDLGHDVSREEARKRAVPGELVGTADVVGLTPDAVIVGDYKTGWAPQAPAAEHRQLRAYALMAARAYGKRRAHVWIVHVQEGREPWFDRGELDAFALAEVELEIRELLATVEAARAEVAAGRMPKTVMGDHCAGCPAYQVCPAQMSLVRQFAAAPETLEDLFRRATPEQLASAYERAVALERVAERVREGIKRIAREKPIDLGNGYVLGAKPEDRIEAGIAIRVLTEVYGPEVAAEASHAEPEVSKSSIERALRKHALKPGKKITNLKRDALKAIAEAGGVKQVQVVERHKPKQEQLKEGVAA